VASILDTTLADVVASRSEGGRPVIRYNPAVLPRLRPASRLFLYAHECARLNLGLPTAGERSLASARRADCWALASLARSGLVKGAAEVAAIQADLAFTAEEWLRLPGPPRRFDLAACRAPAPAALCERGPQWDACVRQCAAPLLGCERGGPAAAACGAAYERCTAACEARFPS
jgi:hypothetical protein